MRNLLCDKTFAQINDLIERINTAIDDNVRDITDVNTHSKKVIFKYHTFDGVEHSIYASNANAVAIVDDNVNAEMLTSAEDDTLYVFGDKNGITIHAVAPAETAHHSWFNDSITVDHLNDDIFYRIECDNTYDDTEGSVDQNFVMYEIGGLKAGRAYTLNITARASVINYDANDLKLVVLDDDGTTVITQQALTKDTSPHDYTVTFTAPDTTVYLKFVLAAIDDFSGSVTNREEFVISKFLFTGMDIGIIDFEFYHNGQWFSVGAGGGGSSDVELIEISKADYDALPQSAKDDPNKAYFVYNYPSGGGGSGGGSGNTISYGTTAPPATANDGDVYYALDTVTGKKKGLYLYENNSWVLIEGEAWNVYTQTIIFGNLNFGLISLPYAHGIANVNTIEVVEAYYNFNYVSSPDSWSDAMTKINNVACTWGADATNVWASTPQWEPDRDQWNASASRYYKVVLKYTTTS